MAWLGATIGFVNVAGDLEMEDGAQFASYVIQDGANDYVDAGVDGQWIVNVDFAIKDQAASPVDENRIEWRLEIQTSGETGGAPAFGPYEPFVAGEYTCRYYRLRATVQVDPVFGQIPEITRFEHNHVGVGGIPHGGSVNEEATTPTGTEEQGARYIVVTPATGDFVNMEEAIAYLLETTDRAWGFEFPVEGKEVFDKDTGTKKRYVGGDWPSGSWVELDPDPAPSPHLLGGAHHSPDSLANLNSRVIGGNLDLSTAQRTAIIHLLGSNLRHGADSLANLNALITGGDLDFDTAARPPTAHTLASHSTKDHSELTSVTSDQHHAQIHKDTHKSGGGDALAATDLLEAIVKRLQVTGPVTLLIGAVADGEFLKRSGTGLISANPIAPDYDSGWFTLTYSTNDVAKTHGLGVLPRQVQVFVSSDSGTTCHLAGFIWVFSNQGYSRGTIVNTITTTTLRVQCGTDSIAGVYDNYGTGGTRIQIGSGHARVLCWK